MGAKAMTKGAFLKAIAEEHGLKVKECSQVVNSLVDIATKEVKKTGLFTVPGLCRIKTRVKPATKAGIKNIFGKEVKVSAKPAKTVVKAYPVHALKKQIRAEQGACVSYMPSQRSRACGNPTNE